MHQCNHNVNKEQDNDIKNSTFTCNVFFFSIRLILLHSLGGGTSLNVEHCSHFFVCCKAKLELR